MSGACRKKTRKFPSIDLKILRSMQFPCSDLDSTAVAVDTSRTL